MIVFPAEDCFFQLLVVDINDSLSEVESYPVKFEAAGIFRNYLVAFFRINGDPSLSRRLRRLASLNAVVIFLFCAAYVASLFKSMRDLYIAIAARRFASLHAVVIFHSCNAYVASLFRNMRRTFSGLVLNRMGRLY